MATILDTIADYARQRVAADKARIGPDAMRELALGGDAGGAAFEAALRRPGMRFICEVKKASPSKGLISPDFPYLDIARAYEAAQADCISCLTEPRWFLGSDGIFREIRGAVSMPMLRKDFTVDEYQIYQARVLGAGAVLLICAILDTRTIARYLELCGSLGLAALVEAHDEVELASGGAAGAGTSGVDNRTWKDFSVDFSNAACLRDLIPPEAVFVAESGVKGPADAAMLKAIGADAALIGEALMRAADKGAMLNALREAAR